MKQLMIAGVMFRVLDLADNKLLLQNLDKCEKESIPAIGEYISKEFTGEIENIVAAEFELLIYVNPITKKHLLEQLKTITVLKHAKSVDIFKIDVCFELAADWNHVTRATKKEKEEIIDMILSNLYPLINYGFQPGFMYLDHLDQSIHVQRRDKPRLKVPAGSLGIGGKYIGIYGSESPGGWNLIGRSSHRIDVKEKHYDFPSIGQKIQFTRLSKEQYLRKYKNET